jgi:DNA-binding response OmpR family regulator
VPAPYANLTRSYSDCGGRDQPARAVQFAAVGDAVRTVLVVDDDDSLRLLCRVNLELEGHRVVEATSLAAARAALGEVRPDVVLLDLHIGREDGLELLGELEGPTAPRVVLFTGSVDIDPGLRARVHAVVPKPFSLDELTAAVSATGV